MIMHQWAEMDPRYSEQAEAFRLRVQTFLAEHLPVDWQGIGALSRSDALEFQTAWRATLHEHGLLAPAWPTEYGGGGLTKLEQVVLVEELAKSGVPSMGASDTFSLKMVGGILLRWGTEEQKRSFLPRILSGEHLWCQGYSEPDSGSDLASLRTHAVREGDEFVITGSKIWQTRALARPTGSSCWPGRTPRRPSTWASRSSWSRWTNRASPSARSG